MEVWVVDNNSQDGSVELVRTAFPEVHLIANSGNPGFSVANNQAIEQARGEYVLLLNPDTVVQEDTFARCIAYLDAHPQAGALGCKMIDGSGTFLPESKRGFPSPWVAFYKSFGLSKLFPKSKRFNHYHLGYLPEDETHSIEILAGAFMFMRKSALDEVGLLDETFFMYGEDIDLSYRILKGGYDVVYFPETRIIHYKGESTKKGSLNYVKVFYKAMIIFAEKHFKGQQASFFIFMMNLAIYLRASITVLTNFIQRAYLPLLDALLIVLGMLWLKDFWATRYFDDPDYYPASFLLFNVPLYGAIWLSSIYFSGGYDGKYQWQRLLRGIVLGTVLIAAVYGFLNMEYRTSRMLILMGAIWLMASAFSLRAALHLLEFKNLRLSSDKARRYFIVGSEAESQRVQQLIYQAQVQHQFMGVVAPQRADHTLAVGDWAGLDQLLAMYRVTELIFCAQDLSHTQIMDCMAHYGARLDYKIVPPESETIIGSSSKNTRGQLYTVEVDYAIDTTMNRRNKRVLDISVALLTLATLPLQLVMVRKPWQRVRDALAVLLGRKTWVGYDRPSPRLPRLRPSVWSERDRLPFAIDEAAAQRLDFFFAKDYTVYRDLWVIWQAWRRGV